MSRIVIPEFRVSEISGTQGFEESPAALGPGSRAVALGRDDK
jgi:hypothetical protein